MESADQAHAEAKAIAYCQIKGEWRRCILVQSEREPDTST
jgi:hypothetical protein